MEVNDWDGWPQGWPVSERTLVGPAACRRCGEQLAGTVRRPTPAGWMHSACAVEYAAEHEPRQLAEPQATAAGMVVCLSDELDSEE
jgi:hypothetical protein